MRETKAVISGYDVEITGHDEGRSACVSHKPSRTGASAEYLFDSGMLYDDNMNDAHRVSQITIDAIDGWLHENGYYEEIE